MQQSPGAAAGRGVAACHSPPQRGREDRAALAPGAAVVGATVPAAAYSTVARDAAGVAQWGEEYCQVR
eukprot:1302148-Alexandrium_andersonii.AAC.1